MSKKTVLLVAGILIVAMGVLALIPSVSLATEPIWHTVAKLVLGVVAVGLALSNSKFTGTMTIFTGVVLAVMGLMGLFLNVEGFSSPSWHSIAVAVVGVVVAYLGAKK